MVLMSKFKHLSRFALDILSSGCLSNKQVSQDRARPIECNNNDVTTTNHYSTQSNDTYEEIITIKHETTFEKSKNFFCNRHLSVSSDDLAEMSESTLSFEPVRSTTWDPSSRGNVNFLLRSLNGPHGIWNVDEFSDCQSNNEINRKISTYNFLKYYVINSGSSSGPMQILVTRKTYNHLEVYNPLYASGAWRVQWDSSRECYIHLMKTNPSTNNNTGAISIKFALDESVLGTTDELRDSFSRQVFVSFSECQTTNEEESGLLDNNSITGPLRVILASTCYKWPGGTILQTTGNFHPERAISRFQSFHARMSREVLIQSDEVVEDELEDDLNTMEQVEELIKALRCATHEEVQSLISEHPEVLKDVRITLFCKSSEIDDTEKLRSLKKALQSFVLFLASNCLNCKSQEQTTFETSEQQNLYDFEELYRAILSFIPDRRSHLVLRDCIVSRIATALDGN